MSTIELMRNAIWQYTTATPQPIGTPAAKTSVGTGRTGNAASPGNAAILPAFVSEPGYIASPNDYNPRRDDRFTRLFPNTIHVGDDGVEIVGTYRAHDSTVANYTQGHLRTPPYWQRQNFPPDFRRLLDRQQVTRYRTFSNTYAPRMVDRSNYFLGYTTDAATAAAIGGNGLGSMGSQ